MNTLSLFRQQKMFHLTFGNFIPEDEAKEGLKDRGLTFEMIAFAAVLGFIPNPARQDQVLLIVEIASYAHAAPCERGCPTSSGSGEFPVAG